MFLLEKGGLSKKVPEVPTVFRVITSNPESRLGIPQELGIVKG